MYIMKKILNWFGNLPKDKVLHFSVSAIIAGLVGAVLTHFMDDPQVAMAIGGTAAFTLGVLKEPIDLFTGGEMSARDIVADALGSLTGLGIGIIPFV